MCSPRPKAKIMRRRDFITLLGSAGVAWPLAARGQQGAMPVIGFVNSAAPGAYPPLSAFLGGLGETGFIEGRNVAIEYRWAEGHYERLPSLLDDLVQRKVSVIAATSTPAAVAAKVANITTPVVFTTGGDPVRLGLVSSLGKPGVNFTGAAIMNVEVAPKRLELMHEAIPTATKFALLINPSGPNAAFVSQEMSTAAAALGVTLQVVRANNEKDLATVFDSFAQLRAEALVIGNDPLFNTHSRELAESALGHHLPAIYQYPDFSETGGLMSYGGDEVESYRVAGVYVGRILKGEKPADLPVQEVTKVELIINLKTAKALGITFPISLLGRADRVIE
jgi:putative tryptophan/tyrosine transport system substrate-binding protein